MRPANPRPSSSTATQWHKKRPSRAQLLRNLEILASLSAPLPPDLPPSPPASRSSSPAPTPKRKHEPSPPEPSKRPRLSEHPRHLPPRPEPTEEGELPDDPPASALTPSPVPASPQLPMQRPRRNLARNDPIFSELHDRYYKYGRLLKYSGTARYWSTFPKGHKEYQPLPQPVPPNSPYHKNGAIIARLEMLDALVCFTYSLWTTDYSKEICSPSWHSIEGFLNWTKGKWVAENSAGEREKAFVGLIFMIEGFILSRKLVHSNVLLDSEMDRLMGKARILVEAAADPVANSTTMPSGQPTPPMLPSPASIAPANSANSTPTGRHSGTPNPTNSTATAPPPASAPPPRKSSNFSSSAPPPPVANTVTLPVSASLTHALKNLTHGVTCAAWCMRQSQTNLTLRTLSQHFPKTLARIVGSSLAHTEESEPDMEDEEGELFWPGSPETGDGLGWVCLLGKAMIKEFGKDVGYLGYDGVVPKPEPR